MITTQCPLCHSDVIVADESFKQDLVTCANCGVDLEIISLSPLTLAALKDEETLA